MIAFFFQAEDGIRDLVRSRGLGDVYKRQATSWSPNVGLVVGATAPAELADVRSLVPGTPLLVPGVGAQGGKPDDVVRAAGYAPGLMVVNASRSILYAGEGAGFANAAGAAARQLRDELRAAAATSP